MPRPNTNMWNWVRLLWYIEMGRKCLNYRMLYMMYMFYRSGWPFSLWIFSNVSSNCLTQRMHWSTVTFQMCPQIACRGGCEITLVAFVWLFSTVCLQMSPQLACLRGCIITLVAFVWLFSTVHFQMRLQSACIREANIREKKIFCEITS